MEQRNDRRQEDVQELENFLDEADKQAEENAVRYTHEEMMGKLRSLVKKELD